MKKIFSYTKRLLLLLCVIAPISLCTAPAAFAQGSQEIKKDTVLSVNLLQVPTSPAFILMGIEPTNIEQPTNPTDFAVSFRNATNNFSALPNNFSLQFAPVWLFNGRKITFRDFQSTRIGKSIAQSLSFSIGYLNTSEQDDLVKSAQLGMGLKFSVLRGTFSPKLENLLQRRMAVLNKISGDFTQEIGASEEFGQVSDAISQTKDAIERIDAKPNPTDADRQDRVVLAQQLTVLEAQLAALTVELETRFRERSQTDLAFLTDSANRVPFNRYGLKLDVAGGMLLDFPDGRFNYSRISRYGAWITGGYDPENKRISVLGVGRLLLTPDEEFVENWIRNVNDNLTLDLGARLVLSNTPRKFNLSGEIIYRNYLNNSEVDPTWRYTLNFDYQFLKNQVVTFSIGRNFEGVTAQGGNLVAAINLLFGLGAQRNVFVPAAQ